MLDDCLDFQHIAIILLELVLCNCAVLKSATCQLADSRTMEQTSLESVQYKLRIPQRKPWGSMVDDCNAAQAIFESRDKVRARVPFCLICTC